MSFPKYKPSRLATLPPTLDPAEYDISPETRKAQAERLAIRSRLKREYQLQYNDPSRRVLIVSGGRPGGSSGGPLGLGSPAPPRGPRSGARGSRPVSQTLALVQAQGAGRRTRPLTLGRVCWSRERVPDPHAWPGLSSGLITSRLDGLEKVMQPRRLRSVFLSKKWG